MINIKNRETSVNKELKELYPAIEECKADIVGLVNGAYLIKRRALPKAMIKSLPAGYLAGIFRAVRFGTEQAHGKAVLLGFNYLRKKGAIIYDKKSQRYSINYKTFNRSVRSLAKELLMIQAKGSYKDAKALLESYAQVSSEMKASLAKITHLPVDIRSNDTVLVKMKEW
jgi:hypothetical protein